MAEVVEDGCRIEKCELGVCLITNVFRVSIVDGLEKGTGRSCGIKSLIKEAVD